MTTPDNTASKQVSYGIISLWVTIILFFSVLMLFFSNSSDIPRYGRSCLTWVIRRWGESDGTFSHGWLLPLVSAGILFWKRDDLKRARREIYMPGLIIVISALVLHVIGYQAMLPRLNLIAFVGFLWGIPLYLLGRETGRILRFPCAYLLFGIPFEFLNELTFPLRLLATKISVLLLNGIGLPSQRIGTMIRSGAAGELTFDVADPCSGLRYLLAITALAALWAFVFENRLWKKWFLFIMSIPLAIAGNVVRILLVAVAGKVFGLAVAKGLYHNFSGYIVFISAFLLLISFSSILQRISLRRNTCPANSP